MEVLNTGELHRLMSLRDSHCLSLYMPTVRAGREVRQNSIRFGNLIARARQELAAAGLRPRAVESFSKPLARLEGDKVFWEQQQDGLALFRTPTRLFLYRLPEHFDEIVFVGNRCHLKPLIVLFSPAVRFWVLALSRQGVRLYQGGRYTLTERRVHQVPKSLTEAMRFEDVEKQLQHHAGTRGSDPAGRGAVLYHGHGAGKAESKDQVLRYFRKVDRGLHRALRRENAPLVLVGLEYLFSIYRNANTYPHVLDQALDANADDLSAEALHRLAWEVMEPHMLDERRQKREEYQRLARSGKSAATLEEVVPAAVFGRVDTLFVRRGEQRWGRFDERSGRLRIIDTRSADSEDLLDLAAVHTLAGGGQVYPFEADEFPQPVAALLRY